MELRPYFTWVLYSHNDVVELFKGFQYGDAPFNITECQWAIATPVVEHQILNVLEEPKQISSESWTPRGNGFEKWRVIGLVVGQHHIARFSLVQ